MSMEQISNIIKSAVNNLYGISDNEIVLSRPDPKFGDFASNVAMQLASKLGKNPRQIATELTEQISKDDELISEASVAGPGFINIKVQPSFYIKTLQQILLEGETFGYNITNDGKQIIAEYSDPNPLKPLHAGHLYTTLVGDSIARLLVSTGANVKRISYGGDVGLHVGKSMWAITKEIGEEPLRLEDIPVEDRAIWLGQKYVEGNNAYTDDEQAAIEIKEVNKKVYDLHAGGDRESNFAQIYWTVRNWSYDYFDELYKQLEVEPFDRTIPESEVVEIGLQTVKANTPNVYQESEGAIIFRGEDYGLHTRVFINSQGLPTYETKDVGLLLTKWNDYKFNASIVITANEQSQYMQVMLKSVEQFEPELAKRSKHLAHGVVKLAGGVKMSSRKGNILGALDILESAKQANIKITGKDDNSAVLAAVKYSFLKQRVGGDIIYDPMESVSVLGNSGPYLQYAYVRAKSIMQKAANITDENINDLDNNELALVRKLDEYKGVVSLAAYELMPHHVCTYLYELAQEFNRFYENNKVIGDTREQQRLLLLRAYVQVLGNGLDLLGIQKPDRM